MNIDFLKARAKITATITRLEADINNAKAELQAFDKVEAIIRRQSGEGSEPAILKLHGDLNGNGGTPPPHGEIPRVVRKGILTKQIVEIVTRAEKPVSAAHVKRGILQNGYIPKGKNFDISVVKTLNRLGDQGVLEKLKDKEGSVTFRPK